MDSRIRPVSHRAQISQTGQRLHSDQKAINAPPKLELVADSTPQEPEQNPLFTPVQDSAPGDHLGQGPSEQGPRELFSKKALELLEFIQASRERWGKWLGLHAYRRYRNSQQGRKLFRKGAMFDKSA